MTIAIRRRRHRPPASAEGLDLYLAEIGRAALLSAEEERELIRAVRAGDGDARERLIRANLRLVVWVARDYIGNGLAMADLIGEGNIGLLRAVGAFNPAFRVRFNTYATYWIKQAICKALMNTGSPIRVPAYMAQLIAKWKPAAALLAARHGRPPTVREIIDHMGVAVPPGRLAILLGTLALADRLRASDRYRRDDPPIEELPGGEADPGYEAAAADETRAVLDAIDRLDERSAAVLRGRFGLGGPVRNLREIGLELGVTREWVRRIELGALSEVRCQVCVYEESPGVIA